jgi:hypothetical protein
MYWYFVMNPEYLFGVGGKITPSGNVIPGIG